MEDTSDVDVLVEFQPGQRVGYIRLAEMELALSDILGRKADLRTQEEIGTGGGGFRFMYAAFLQEAGDLLASAPLGEASCMMTEAGNLWRQFALVSARFCKSKTADGDMDEIVQRLQMCATQEKLVYTTLKSLNL